jgi:hypothetical protein
LISLLVVKKYFEFQEKNQENKWKV